jgi:hypothetical protein
MSRLRKSKICPIHRSRFCCGREKKALAFTRGVTKKGPVTRVTDPYHPRGYREMCTPAEINRRLKIKLREQNGKCAICGFQIEDMREAVADHIEPRGMNGAFRDDHIDNLQAAHKSCNELKRDGIRPSDLIYGSLICIVYLVSCSKTQLVRGSRTAQQLIYGNYANDRFAWVTDPAKTIVLPQAVPFRGAQGLFEWPAGDLYIPESERVPEGLFA